MGVLWLCTLPVIWLYYGCTMASTVLYVLRYGYVLPVWLDYRIYLYRLH
jgi:hypothetical protein